MAQERQETLDDQITRRNSFLYVICDEAIRIRNDLERLEDLIQRYNKNPQPERWNRVKEYAKPTLEGFEQTRRFVWTLYNPIQRLIRNPNLTPNSFDIKYIWYTGGLYADAIRLRDSPRIEDQYYQKLITAIRE